MRAPALSFWPALMVWSASRIRTPILARLAFYPLWTMWEASSAAIKLPTFRRALAMAATHGSCMTGLYSACLASMRGMRGRPKFTTL